MTVDAPPLVEAVRADQAATFPKRLEGGGRVDGFRAGVNGVVADLFVFGPVRDEAPMERVLGNRTITLPFRQGYGSKPSRQTYASENRVS